MGKNRNRNRRFRPDPGPPAMENGKYYNLNPPSNTNGKRCHRAKCLFRDVSRPNHYIMRGIPEGESSPHDFILAFGNQGIKVTPAEDQSLDGRCSDGQSGGLHGSPTISDSENANDFLDRLNRFADGIDEEFENF